MIRTVVQQGDAANSKRTVEFDEKGICHLELVEPAAEAEAAPPDLKVYLHGRVEPILVTEPDVVKKLWKPAKKPGKKTHE